MLIIDGEDTYGSDFASFTLSGLEEGRLIGAAESSPPDVLRDEAGAAAARHAFTAVPLQARGLPVTGLRSFVAPGADVGSRRGYILDLVPKVRGVWSCTARRMGMCGARRNVHWRLVGVSRNPTPAAHAASWTPPPSHTPTNR